MKKKLLVCALFLLAATPAVAQINFAWRNCLPVRSDPIGSTINQNSACDAHRSTYPGTYTAVVSFIAPPNITSFVGATAEVEVITVSPVLPDYWRHGAGECRETSFTAGFTGGLGTGTTGACQDPYDGSPTTRSWYWTSGIPTVDRATCSVQLTRETGRPLIAGQEYLANAVVFDTDRDDSYNPGDDNCAGCVVPACLVVKQLEIRQESPLPSVVLIGPQYRKFILWNGGAPAESCAGQILPVRNQTWGAIKAIYR